MNSLNIYSLKKKKKKYVYMLYSILNLKTFFFLCGAKKGVNFMIGNGLCLASHKCYYVFQ